MHVLTMVALRPAGKFARLHADLEERGATRPFDGVLENWTYEPPAETERAAREVLSKLPVLAGRPPSYVLAPGIFEWQQPRAATQNRC